MISQLKLQQQFQATSPPDLSALFPILCMLNSNRTCPRGRNTHNWIIGYVCEGRCAPGLYARRAGLQAKRVHQ